MPTPTDNDNKSQDSSLSSGRTWHRSVHIPDPGGATPADPHPTHEFIDPNPSGGGMLSDEWKRRSSR
jgi:hypothetical protein